MFIIRQQKKLRNRSLTKKKTQNTLSKKLAHRISRSFLIPQEELILLDMSPQVDIRGVIHSLSLGKFMKIEDEFNANKQSKVKEEAVGRGGFLE